MKGRIMAAGCAPTMMAGPLLAADPPPVPIPEHQGWKSWRREFTKPRLPQACNLRPAPFERTDESMIPFETGHRFCFTAPGRAVVAKRLESFAKFPPRRKPAKCHLDEVMRKFTGNPGGAN